MASLPEKKDLNFEKALQKGKAIRRDNNKYIGHKFQQVVIQALHKKGEEHDNSDSEESENEFEIPEEVGAILNLSKKNMKDFPNELLDKIQSVQYLYLEGNKLTELPTNFFQNAYSLKWLDLRNNYLSSLPTIGLKNHKCLEVILLQGNRIRNLPVELATIPSLKGLQTTGNAITNVPYEVMAEGFQAVIKYLGKLCSQNEVLLPFSEIVVKPSTSQDDPSGKSMKVEEPTESELRMLDLDKLSGWQPFMKKRCKNADSEMKYYVSKNEKKQSVPQQSKISVSVRSHSKMSYKPAPFRCGTYNKNRHKIVSSALHYRKVRKSRLGYKRKPITVAMIQEKAREEACKTQMREILEKQARKIQRMRDKEVLKSWRSHARITKQQMKLLDNYQQYPSKDFASKTPFDTDPEFLNMLSRVDVYRSLKEYDNRSRRNKKPRARISAVDLERQMNEIMSRLQQLDTNEETEISSPRSKQNHICSRMSKIFDIQKTLKNLQTLNSSTNGIMPILKSKSTK